MIRGLGVWGSDKRPKTLSRKLAHQGLRSVGVGVGSSDLPVRHGPAPPRIVARPWSPPVLLGVQVPSHETSFSKRRPTKLLSLRPAG